MMLKNDPAYSRSMANPIAAIADYGIRYQDRDICRIDVVTNPAVRPT